MALKFFQNSGDVYFSAKISTGKVETDKKVQSVPSILNFSLFNFPVEILSDKQLERNSPRIPLIKAASFAYYLVKKFEKASTLKPDCLQNCIF